MNREEHFKYRFSKIFKITELEAGKTLSCQPKSSLILNKFKDINNDVVSEILSITATGKIDWYENAYIINEGKEKIINSKYFIEGNFYIQNASSLIPVLALNPVPGSVILDMCAAPGGKTYNIAQITDNKAFIYVNDESGVRLKKVKDIASLYGLKIVHYFNQPAQYLYKHTVQKYDYILVDAPCSGEGEIVFGKYDFNRYWNIKKIKRLASLQKNILESAYKLLASDGTLVYSTCTYAPEENEDVVNYMLSKHPGLELSEINLKLDNMSPALTNWENQEYSTSLSKALRIFPNEYMEGFFVAKFVKKG